MSAGSNHSHHIDGHLETTLNGVFLPAIKRHLVLIPSVLALALFLWNLNIAFSDCA